MQLKGLVRFFTILLIIYSVYQLSFTWLVQSHEKKMAARAKSFVKTNYESATKKYPDNKDSQAIYQEQLDKVYQERLKRLLDSTKDVIITYGPSGKISYQKAKEQELNLGLDLQGGMNVTMEVEMNGLIRAMANNSKDPNFLKALQNANTRKANSNADFVTLFVEEYKKVNPGGNLASLFSAANPDKIKIGDSDDKVKSALRSEANDAFDRTYRVLRTRIDQFGVAQPNINPDRNKAIITVELPGIEDKDRVRKYLQSSANLQFWELYNISELWAQIVKADDAFFTMMGGKIADTTKNKIDSTNTKKDTTGKQTSAIKDTTKKLSEELKQASGNDTSKKKDITPANEDTRKHLANYISFAIDQQKQQFIDNGTIGLVAVKDTGIVRTYLESAAVKSQFPAEVAFLYGIPESDAEK